MSVVLVGGLDEYLTTVAAGLLKRGVPVTHFLDRYQRPASQQGALAGVSSIDARQFMDPVRIRRLNHGHPPLLDALALQSFAKAQAVWLTVTDRYTQTLSVQERLHLFRELLEYFYRWLQQENVRAIVFPNVPHAGWNNVLYFVAKHLHITTLILEATRLNDRVVVWEDYEAVAKVPPDWLPGATAAVARQHVDPALLAELSTDSSWMVLSDDINRRALQEVGALREFVGFLRALAWGTVNRNRPRDLAFDPPWSWWGAHWRRYQLLRRARELRALYEGLSTRKIPDEPFILFFLNYQPEKTTTPMGGIFDDQLLAVRLLAAGMPVGWRLLVKEHPRQFGAHVDAAPYRSQEFYKELAALPNVQLVHPLAPTAPLLAECRATATITGSIGWQGLLQGKPTINFGRSWYAACRSCYVVSSRDDIALALQEIQHTSAPAVEVDILKFLAYERESFIIGSNADSYVARSTRPADELADSLAAALTARLQASLKTAVFNDVIKAHV